MPNDIIDAPGTCKTKRGNRLLQPTEGRPSRGVAFIAAEMQAEKIEKNDRSGALNQEATQKGIVLVEAQDRLNVNDARRRKPGMREDRFRLMEQRHF